MLEARALAAIVGRVVPLLLVIVASWATPPVAPALALPPAEAVAAWNDALDAAGLVRGAGGVQVVVQGGAWRLSVSGEGGERVAMVEVPRTPLERERVAIVAASLLRGGALVQAPAVPARSDGGSVPNVSAAVPTLDAATTSSSRTIATAVDTRKPPAAKPTVAAPVVPAPAVVAAKPAVAAPVVPEPAVVAAKPVAAPAPTMPAVVAAKPVVAAPTVPEPAVVAVKPVVAAPPAVTPPPVVAAKPAAAPAAKPARTAPAAKPALAAPKPAVVAAKPTAAASSIGVSVVAAGAGVYRPGLSSNAGGELAARALAGSTWGSVGVALFAPTEFDSGSLQLATGALHAGGRFVPAPGWALRGGGGVVLEHWGVTDLDGDRTGWGLGAELELGAERVLVENVAVDLAIVGTQDMQALTTDLAGEQPSPLSARLVAGIRMGR